MRAASALVLAPLALLCTWYGGWAWTLLVQLATALLVAEWMAMMRADPAGLGRLSKVPVVYLTMFLTATAIGRPGTDALVGVAAQLALTILVLLVLTRRPVAAAGILYIGLPMAALVWLRDTGEAGRSNVLFLAVVVWASDIGAYVAGRWLGGRKLAPSISPGKTWSGAIGGLVAAMLFGEATAQALAPSGLGRAAAAACLLSVVSQAGDLLESWIKRQFGVKDSGRLIPGHGGLLDRLDGMLAAATAAACIAAVVGRGGVLWQ